MVWPRLLSTCVMCGIPTRSASSHASSLRVPSYLCSFSVLLVFCFRVSVYVFYFEIWNARASFPAWYDCVSCAQYRFFLGGSTSVLPMVLLRNALSRSSQLYEAWYVLIVIAQNSVVLSSSLGPVSIPPPPRVPLLRPCSSAAVLLLLVVDVVAIVVCCRVVLTGPEHLRLFAHAIPPGSPAVLPLLAVSMVCPSVGDYGGGGFRAAQRVAQVTRAHAGKV